MGDYRRKRCVICGRHRDEVGELSWSGKCTECWPPILEANALEISAGAGPGHVRRLRGYARWLERELLDAATHSP